MTQDRHTGGAHQEELHWFRVDLHIHTPASEDYADERVSYLDILKEAERRGLEIIAFTDHNTVHGYEQMRREIEFLETLEQTGRCTDEERERLAEYRRLTGRITILPGFEFTSHFGAHILGIFAPETPLSLIEATLIQLGVPVTQLKQGSCSISNTRHVTEAYEIIARNGGLVIAAHVNAPGGVVTETLRLGTSGQARIAATQSPHLHALEFINYYTDHEPFTSPTFYRGQHDHYTRPMFCIQGSDAHRLRRSEGENNGRQLHGIGDRYFEALLSEPSFQALHQLFISHHFDRVRVPKRDQKQWEIDQARWTGGDERHILRSMNGGVVPLWKDVAALANMGGGVLIVGAGDQGSVEGVTHPEQVSEELRRSVQEHIEPQPYMTMELIKYEGHDVIRVEVRTSDPPPYMGRDGVIYVRCEGETRPASRGDVLQLARQALAQGATSPLDNGEDLELPRSGVEIVSEQKRGGVWVYEVRDLRTTAGVTRDRAQGLWAYAISRHEDLRDNRTDLYSQVKWKGRVGLWRAFRQGNRTKYDLVHRDANGVVDHIFYGVSDWGLGKAWQTLLSDRAIDEPEEELIEEESKGSVQVAYEQQQVALENGGAHQQESLPWGDRRYRWRNRGAIWRITKVNGEPRFDLAMRDKESDEVREFRDVPRSRLTEAWLHLIRVPAPRTGIEVIAVREDEYGRSFVFRNMRTGELSDPWRETDLEPGTVREYAARMYLQDTPLEESNVRWWGNIGYTRPMRSQVDLVYRDEFGVDHIYYAARREELTDEWKQLLEQWPDE